MNRPELSTNPADWQGAIDINAGLLDLPAGIEDADGPQMAPVALWFDFVIPTYNQYGPSCVGESWANWTEAMARRWIGPDAIPDGMQIDGTAIWKRGREMFWGGNMSGGLYLPQGFKAAQDLGIIPPDATLVEVGKDWNSINLALLASPLVQGHRIHKGWFRADRESGCIDHEPAPDNSGAHATLLIGTGIQPDRAGNPTRWRFLQNSWGARVGRYGFFTMTEAEWFEGIMTAGPFTAEIKDFRAWTGWKKYLVERG